MFERYEEEFPEMADTKPPRDCCVPSETPSKETQLKEMKGELHEEVVKNFEFGGSIDWGHRVQCGGSAHYRQHWIYWRRLDAR
jgi:hypothetical protein